MTIPEEIKLLIHRINSAQDSHILLECVDELNRLELKNEHAEEIDTLRLDVLESLSQLTQTNPNKALPIIMDYLVPLCLRDRSQWKEISIALRYDNLLTSWLGRFPFSKRYKLRSDILKAISEELHGVSPTRSCQLVSLIGYRDESIFEQILEICRSGLDDIQDLALHVLTTLGPSESQKSIIVQIWKDRVSTNPWNQDLVGAARRLAELSMLDEVFKHWLSKEVLRKSNPSDLLPSIAISIPSAIAERNHQNSELQDKIWEQIEMLQSSAPDLLFKRVLYSTQVAHPCDSPGVLRYFLSELGTDPRNRYLVYLRLEECDRPRQLLGWESALHPEIYETLSKEALTSSGMQGAFMSLELKQVEHAWQTLLSLARGEVLDGLDSYLNEESNGYAIGTILDIAACFRIEPLPAKLCNLIRCEFGKFIDDESEMVNSHIGAISVARGSGSESSFEALLNFKTLNNLGVLVTLIDALSDVSIELIQAGNSSCVSQLIKATEPDVPKHRQTAAVATLGRLMKCGLLKPLPVEHIVRIIEDDSLDRYARREVIHGLGYLSREDIPPEIVQLLWRLANTNPADPENRGQQNSDLRAICLASLARLGVLQTEIKEMHTHLGLKRETGQLSSDSLKAFPGIAVILGILYQREPYEYASVIAELLRKGQWADVFQLSAFLRSGPRPAPEQIHKAILDRIQNSGSEAGEPDLVILLAELSPQSISNESWAEMFGWPPQVRASLAQALERSQASGESDKRVSLLLVLMGDGQYGVRRAAYRALNKISPKDLLAVCTGWALLKEEKVYALERPFVVDLRKRAAEAAAWLSSFPTEGPISELAWDPEPEVRSTYERCQRERLERLWAEEYLSHVLSVFDENSLLKAWKYGRALQRVGDDDILDRLEDRYNKERSPRIRHWLRRLIKSIRSRWDDVTRKWPEPWFARRGRLEFVNAVVGEHDNQTEVSCWLWEIPPSNLVEFGVWGGWCDQPILSSGEHRSFHVNGRQSANILITKTHFPSGPTYFVGNGEYPCERLS